MNSLPQQYQLCIRTYAHVPILSKFKYAGLHTSEVLNIYKLFIRSIVEYCSVVYHSSLTQDQDRRIENIQRVCLKVILDKDYVSYESALAICSLENISQRREDRCLSFALRAIKHPQNAKMFPLSDKNMTSDHNVRNSEKFKVNFARTSSYMNSSIIFCQHFSRTCSAHPRTKQHL